MFAREGSALICTIVLMGAAQMVYAPAFLIVQVNVKRVAPQQTCAKGTNAVIMSNVGRDAAILARAEEVPVPKSALSTTRGKLRPISATVENVWITRTACPIAVKIKFARSIASETKDRRAWRGCIGASESWPF